MDTRWKNRAILIAWLLLFTFGLSGILSALSNGGDYLKRDYFQTQEFQYQLSDFTDGLGMFELNYLPPEEMKKELTVTPEEINEHRYRYGNLAEQITNIKQQYEQKILDAQTIKNKELAAIYIAERDQKIEDITNNFKSDEYVKAKIIKGKEQQVDKYYQELEDSRREFNNLKAGFVYHLEDVKKGKIYTNLNVASNVEVNEAINNKNMLYIRSYTAEELGYLSLARSDELLGPIKSGQFTGKIGVPKSAPAASVVMSNYYDYQQRQKLLFIYTLCSVSALLLSLYIYKKTILLKISVIEKWQAHYTRIPIDISTLVFVITSFITVMILSNNSNLYLHDYLYSFIKATLHGVMLAAIFLALTVIQGKLLYERVKNWPSLKEEWKRSIISRVFQVINGAFTNRSMGTQILLLLMVVFASGLGAAGVIVEPELIVIYAPLFLIVCIPTVIVIFKRTGYFNRIVSYTSELIRGEMGADLPVAGKSSLATLARNINTLKHGVKTSQTEQAKSERLKTELITNVSHDLRTPLTSIITYTELLKTPDLSPEERESYVEIIDRKSKRLKVLIDDLFEASKMASGSIELVKEKVDIVQLLQQALAEHNEAISESTLQFRIANLDKPLYAIVDGQKLWRVFDNLIGNILKYSLENTRVYISVKSLPGQARIIFKNVTKYELGENIDEMFERFKRGDTSRNTEGSGLGLAIAKSIMDLHGGDLDIEVDGDLFKITVTLATTN